MEDVLQDAYVKAYRALPSFRGESSPGTWLYRITYNACLDELRRQRKIVVLPLCEAADRPDPRPGPGERFGLRWPWLSPSTTCRRPSGRRYCGRRPVPRRRRAAEVLSNPRGHLPVPSVVARARLRDRSGRPAEAGGRRATSATTSWPRPCAGCRLRLTDRPSSPSSRTASVTSGRCPAGPGGSCGRRAGPRPAGPAMAAGRRPSSPPPASCSAGRRGRRPRPAAESVLTAPSPPAAGPVPPVTAGSALPPVTTVPAPTSVVEGVPVDASGFDAVHGSWMATFFLTADGRYRRWRLAAPRRSKTAAPARPRSSRSTAGAG